MVSVVIPSALKKRPDGTYWLERAIRSAQSQSQPPGEIIVALDPGEQLPFQADVTVVRGKVKGHQSASNEAVRNSRYALVAFLEDDDTWAPTWLATSMAALSHYNAQFVSASQTIVDPDGAVVGRFHFPTASSWLLPRLTFLVLEGFDTRFKLHHDNEFLGKLGAKGFKRVHLVPEPASRPGESSLNLLCPHTWVVPGPDVPQVYRTKHPDSVLGLMSAQQSEDEYAALRLLYGSIPW